MNDLVIRKYEGVRISQMLWAIYFIRGRLLEIGILQFEYSYFDWYLDNNRNKVYILKRNITFCDQRYLHL